MHVGVGKFRIVAYLDGSGLMSPGEMMCPTNSISVPISNFFLEIVFVDVCSLASCKNRVYSGV